jgi:long-chain acyl-CoA synthetase
MNIADNVDRAARHFPDRPAIIFEGRQISYRQLRDQVDRVARGLLDQGVVVGDRVALFLPNIPEFFVAYLAAQKIGAIAVAVNVMLTSEELGYIVEDSGAGLLFTTADLLSRLEGVLERGFSSDRVVLCEGAAPGFQRLADLGAGSTGQLRPLVLEASTPAAILYTSGTTGKQKGATLSHGNVLSNVVGTLHCLRTLPDDRLLLYLPLFHCFGQNYIANAGLAAAATLVMHRRFELDEIVDSIERNRVTMVFAVPATYITLLNAEVAPQRLASVRYYFSAAAPLPVEVGRRWCAVHGHAVHEGYGLTESSPAATYNHVWDHRPGSAGTPLPLVDINVVDELDQEVGDGAWGEVCIKGPNVMLGYWNRPAETAEALRGGWLHTGDVGYLDEDGYLFIVDRTKDMINAAGFKIWPREVEEVLYQHPAIKECAVVGVADPLKGEAAKAYVILQPEASLSADELERYCRGRLAAYKVPHLVEFVSDIPKNATGKILKRVLREHQPVPTTAPPA